MTADEVSDFAQDVFTHLIRAGRMAQKRGVPDALALACALEASVNMLTTYSGKDRVADMLEELAELIRSPDVLEHGWVMDYLDWPETPRL